MNGNAWKNGWSVIVCLVVVCLASVLCGTSIAATFQWDRGPEADLDHYEMYACTASPTCDPIVEGARFGANVPQTAVGVKPTLAIPLNALAGRAQVLAADKVGNKSPGSNIVPFRGQALGASTGLQVLP